MSAVVDFALLPPEINSLRIYTGAGSAPLLAAAAAWDAVAAELNSTASAYRSVLSTLTGGPWLGPSASSMMAATAPYVSWLDVTAAQVEQTAGQLYAAAAAYDAAFSATVPPVAIEVNRVLMAALVATNVFGQNTPAIAATEAQYAEMWAQDASAMYGYAEASAAATRLTPFGSPPQITQASTGLAVTEATAAATGSSTYPALSELLAAVPGALQNLATAGAFNPVTWLESVLGSPTGTALNVLAANAGNLNLVFSGFLYSFSAGLTLAGTLGGLAASADAAAAVPLDAGSTSVPATYTSTVGESVALGRNEIGTSASFGNSATVGTLSVPPSWVSAPAIRLAATALPSTALTPTGAAGPEWLAGGIPPVGSVVNAPRGEQSRLRSTPAAKVVAAMPGERTADARNAVPAAQSQRSIGHAVSTLSEHERAELARLREQITEVATERDAAARLIKEAML